MCCNALNVEPLTHNKLMYHCLFSCIWLLLDQEGGFYSAEDADSYPTADSREKKEGAFCVWTHQQVRDVLSGTNTPAGDKLMADLFSYHYDVRQSGNVDPYQVSSLHMVSVFKIINYAQYKSDYWLASMMFFKYVSGSNCHPHF